MITDDRLAIKEFKRLLRSRGIGYRVFGGLVGMSDNSIASALSVGLRRGVAPKWVWSFLVAATEFGQKNSTPSG